MKKTKIVALILLLSMLTIILASCSGKTAEELLASADKRLETKAYSVDVEIEYTTFDYAVEKIFEQLGETEVEVYVNGDKMRIENESVINYGEGEVLFHNRYVVINGVVYADISYTMDGYDNISKAKAPITEEERLTLFEKKSVACGIKADDFTTVALHERDKETVICTGLEDGTDVALEYIMINQLEGAADKVDLVDASLTIEMDGGRYDTVLLSCTYNVWISGTSYKVVMDVEMDYDYDGVRIVTPANTELYNEISFKDIP